MPVLTIEIPWNPNITTIGGFLLTWHGLFTAVGILAGVQLSLHMGKVVGYDPDRAYTLALVGVPSGIIGARALFVAEHWDFYGDNLGEILQINEGGISVWGAVLGGIIGGLLFALWRGYPIPRALDIAAFGTILGMAIGRLGDLVNGEHLARATDLPWAVLYTNPESPAFAHSLTVGAHHPATTYEMLGDLAILGLLFFVLYRVFRERPGMTFITFLVTYSAMRFLVTYLRVDSDEVFGTPLRTPQVVSVVVILACIPAAWYFLTRPRQPFEQLPEAPAPPAARTSAAARRRSAGAVNRSTAVNVEVVVTEAVTDDLPQVHEVTLYGAPGCHLCEDAAAALKRLRRRHPFALSEVDIHSDPDLERRFLLEIPVIEVDGAVVTHAPIDIEAVRAAVTVGA